MAVSPAPARSSLESNGASDWPAEAAGMIERTVLSVRDATTGKVQFAAKALVYGLFAGLVGMAVAVMIAVILVRVVNVYLPDSVFGESHTWAAHLVVGTAFVALALLCVWLRRPRKESND